MKGKKTPEKPLHIWFRAGMDAEVTKEELDILLKDESAPGKEAHTLMREIIRRAVLTGETYIVGMPLPGSSLANPAYDVDFDF